MKKSLPTILFLLVFLLASTQAQESPTPDAVCQGGHRAEIHGNEEHIFCFTPTPAQTPLATETPMPTNTAVPATPAAEPTQTPTPGATATPNNTYLPITIMAMGDSHVEGYYWVNLFFADYGKYAGQDPACDMDLVGYKTPGNLWVPGREGYGGQTTDDFLANNWHETAVSIWHGDDSTADNRHPDVVLLMLGSNDYSGGADEVIIAENSQQIVNEIHALSPEITVFTGIVPRRGQEAEMSLYDLELQSLTDVVYVDFYSGFDSTTMLQSDGVHLNNTGGHFVSDTYYAALQSEGFCP